MNTAGGGDTAGSQSGVLGEHGPFYAAGTFYTKPRGSYPFNNAITYQFHANAVPENP